MDWTDVDICTQYTNTGQRTGRKSWGILMDGLYGHAPWAGKTAESLWGTQKSYLRTYQKHLTAQPWQGTEARGQDRALHAPTFKDRSFITGTFFIHVLIFTSCCHFKEVHQMFWKSIWYFLYRDAQFSQSLEGFPPHQNSSPNTVLHLFTVTDISSENQSLNSHQSKRTVLGLQLKGLVITGSNSQIQSPHP